MDNRFFAYERLASYGLGKSIDMWPKAHENMNDFRIILAHETAHRHLTFSSTFGTFQLFWSLLGEAIQLKEHPSLSALVEANLRASLKISLIAHEGFANYL